MKSLQHQWVIPTTEWKKNGYFIFSTSKQEGKERKEANPLPPKMEFLVYKKSNEREDLTRHNTFGIVLIIEMTLIIASIN